MNNSLDRIRSRKLRIAFCGTRGIPYSYGGAEDVIGELAPQLAARGHEVTVYCRHGLFRERPEVYRGVRLIYLRNFESKVLGTPTHTARSLIDAVSRNYDLIVVWNLPSVPFCVIPSLFGKRLAIMVDGMDWRRDKWGPVGKMYLYLSARWAGSISPRGIITDTTDMQRLYQQEFGTTSACIPCAAKIETSTDSNLVLKYGLQPFQYYLIASRLVPENNADLILKAFEQLRSERLLAIAGSANYRSKFVERLKRTNDPRVRFLGHVADPELLKELHCNAYAYIHGHSMGGTNPSLLKALGCGNCVLALNTASNSEVLADFGITFEPAASDLLSKLQRVEDNPELAVKLRQRAPERIREAYSWDEITDQYEEFFLRLVMGENVTASLSRVPASD